MPDGVSPRRASCGEPKPSSLVATALQRYLNRLSDYLFVLGRYATVREGLEEETYKP